MKRLLCFFLFALFFCSCKDNYGIKNWIAISVQDDENTAYNGNSKDPLIYSKINADITFNLFLLPESNEPIKLTEVYSSNSDVLNIVSVDPKTRILKAKALKTGTAKIFIQTKNNGSTSTLTVIVQ